MDLPEMIGSYGISANGTKEIELQGIKLAF